MEFPISYCAPNALTCATMYKPLSWNTTPPLTKEGSARPWALCFTSCPLFNLYQRNPNFHSFLFLPPYAFYIYACNPAVLFEYNKYPVPSRERAGAVRERQQGALSWFLFKQFIWKKKKVNLKFYTKWGEVQIYPPTIA